MSQAARNLPVIFLAFANERDGRVLPRLQDERRQLQDALQPLDDAGLCQLVIEPSATLNDVTKRLIQYGDRLAIFHFAGHAGPTQVRLETERGGSASMFAGGFARLLSNRRPPDIVFLNGCSSAEQASTLLDLDVLAVIGTTEAIDDRVATQFSALFYRQVAKGDAVTTAFEFAKNYFMTKFGKDRSRAMQAAGSAPSSSADWPWTLHTRPQNTQRAASWTLTQLQNTPLPKVDAVMLGYLCDRKDQLQTFFETTLPEHQARDPRRPLGLVLHGASGEAHEQFVRRLREWDMPRYLQRQGRPATAIELVSIDWKNNVDALRARLAFELTRREDASLDEIQAAMVETRSPIIVKTTVFVSDWQDKTAQVIDDWFALFARFGDLPANQMLLPMVLLFEKRARGRGWLQALRAPPSARYVRGLSAPSDLSLAALPKLESVSRDVVTDEWLSGEFEMQVADCATDLTRPPAELVAELRPFVKDMYAKADNDALPMEDLGDSLALKIRRIFEGDS